MQGCRWKTRQQSIRLFVYMMRQALRCIRCLPRAARCDIRGEVTKIKDYRASEVLVFPLVDQSCANDLRGHCSRQGESSTLAQSVKYGFTRARLDDSLCPITAPRHNVPSRRRSLTCAGDRNGASCGNTPRNRSFSHILIRLAPVEAARIIRRICTIVLSSDATLHTSICDERCLILLRLPS